VIITPARDEQDYIEKTITSVIAQSIQPKKWVIVNDGSKDNTPNIVEKYIKDYSWITTINRIDRGIRKPGVGVVEAFYDGYKIVDDTNWDFVVKLDADLFFESDYFEKCFHKFFCMDKLGIGGGTVISVSNNEKQILEKSPVFHVRGATKIYRKKCWLDIQGLELVVGWDTIDELRSNMMGWVTMTFMDIQIYQQRQTGAMNGLWKNSVKNGRANYITGYHPLFMILKFIKRFFQRPYFLGACGLFYGFISSYFLKDIKKINDKELIKFTRSAQLNKIMLKKTFWR
jgi:glycosyltransferase involved in cell wall biosynthesis